MRILILFIGVSFLIAISAKEITIEPGIVVTITEQDNKMRVIDWMGRESRMQVEKLKRIYEEAHKHAFPELLIAIAKVESNFDPDAVSYAGATGLMQVMSHVWAEELKQAGVIASEDDLFDISRCMAASAYILKRYLSWEEGNLKNALKRYVGVRSDTDYHNKVLETLSEIYAMKYQED